MSSGQRKRAQAPGGILTLELQQISTRGPCLVLSLWGSLWFHFLPLLGDILCWNTSHRGRTVSGVPGGWETLWNQMRPSEASICGEGSYCDGHWTLACLGATTAWTIGMTPPAPTYTHTHQARKWQPPASKDKWHWLRTGLFSLLFFHFPAVFLKYILQKIGFVSKWLLCVHMMLFTDLFPLLGNTFFVLHYL